MNHKPEDKEMYAINVPTVKKKLFIIPVCSPGSSSVENETRC